MSLHITVVFSPIAREVREVELVLALGSTVNTALHSSGLFAEFPELNGPALKVGVWGRNAPLDQRLQERDRVELYRPLLVDPKVARRERFVKQGAKTAGLFARRRAGAKAGY